MSKRFSSRVRFVGRWPGVRVIVGIGRREAANLGMGKLVAPIPEHDPQGRSIVGQRDNPPATLCGKDL